MSPRLASEPSVESPYIDAQTAADHLLYKSVKCLYKAVVPLKIPVHRRGRSLLFVREELDRWLAGERTVDLLRTARAPRHVPRLVAAQPSKEGHP
jgi:hypothetical protein